MTIHSRHLVVAFALSLVAAFLLPNSIDSQRGLEESIATLTVPPNLNKPLPDFSKIKDVKEKKEAFFSFLSPLVDYSNALILQDRQFISRMSQQAEFSPRQKKRLQKLAESYRVSFEDGFDQQFFATMLRRVNTIPPALALAQAANESAWGTSRFARKGNNLFGEWCFKRGCGIKPSQRDEDANHEVATFDRVFDSIQSYMLNLNRHDTYRGLRSLREDLASRNDGVSALRLAEGLQGYSSRGEEYISELQSMIRVNNLEERYRL